MSLEKFAKKRVLIVDELEAFRFSTKQALMSLGMKMVDSASTAQSVISGFQNVHYDVVLCNYDLGKGKNGQELLEELRHRRLLKFTGLFFIITAEVERGKVMGTLENEPDGYLVKPVTPNDLKQRLGKALEQKEALVLINEAIDDGDYRTALAYCDARLEEKAPYSLTCSKTKAWLLGKLGKLKDARDFYEHLLKNTDAAWVEYGLAKTLIKLNTYDRAEDLLKGLLEKEPDHVEAMDLLAELYKQRGKTQEAQAVVERAIQRSPNSLLRQKELADLCIENKDTEGANEAFKSVIKLGDQSVYAKPDQYYDYAQFLANEHDSEQGQDLDEAFKLLAKANKRFSNTAQIETQSKLVGACIHATTGNTEEAEKILDEALVAKKESENPYDPGTLQVMAKTMSVLGHDEEAEKLLEEAADLAERDSDSVADIYDQMNASISSEARVQAATYNKAGIKLYSEGKIEEAAKELRMAIPLTPRHISLNLNLIQVLLKLQQSNNDPQYKKEIERSLQKVRHIPSHHYEYPRYNFLKNKFEKFNV